MPRPRTILFVVIAFFAVRALLPAEVKRGLSGTIRTLALAIAIYLVVGLVLGIVRLSS